MEHPEHPTATHLFDLLLLDAIALTADPARPEIRGSAIGIRDGCITWLDAQPPAHYQATRTLRLPGHFVTPGFVNVHTHGILTMVRGVAADLGFAPSYTPGIPKGTQVDPAQARALARLGALEALLFGSTVIGDNFVHADVSTEAVVELGVRLCPSWRIHDVDFARVAHGDWHHDPAIGSRTLEAGLALHARWAGHPRVRVNLAAHAVDTCSDGFLKEVAAASALHGLTVSTHLGQSQVEVLEEVGLLNERLMGGHCIYVTPSDAQKMAAAGAHAVHIPKCNATSGRLAPTPMLQRAGVNMALATDTQHGDMVELMRWALVTARVQEGKVDDSWQPHHVFHMATMGGAKALGMADTLGSLAVGKAADLVVFDANRPHLRPHVNPLGNLVHTGQGRDVRMVVVAGEVLVEDGRPTKVDMEAVCAEAETASRALWGDEGRRYWE
ncbi:MULTISPECIES: amidohydrolase family protein [unclassified Variovorax]|uniref:amidohydrolase family protein n=1 Tax=unclassified Variovorax TaxID=663243 RepID=UPI0025771222|nr:MULTISPECIES: amidohydrolase family protein [unclassified Variovorax]MDM0090509.1 amidohydrolase family protein [Variovorax sp. J22G40]MDM0147826.1 amidohydrolase family protein [Variovorax sp. J2P1-31]